VAVRFWLYVSLRPLREFNSNGLADPLFHFVERFETRFFFSWLMTRIPTPNSSWRTIAR
jgi:hypothetical protein